MDVSPSRLSRQRQERVRLSPLSSLRRSAERHRRVHVRTYVREAPTAREYQSEQNVGGSDRRARGVDAVAVARAIFVSRIRNAAVDSHGTHRRHRRTTRRSDHQRDQARHRHQKHGSVDRRTRRRARSRRQPHLRCAAVFSHGAVLLRSLRTSVDAWQYEPTPDFDKTPISRLKDWPRYPNLLVYSARSIANLIVRLALRVYHRIEIIGRENLPTTASFVIVANHSSHLDAPALLASLPLK